MRLAILALALALGLVGCGATSSSSSSGSGSDSGKSSDRHDVDKHTRAYLKEVDNCAGAVALAGSLSTGKETDIEAADTITKVRDVCDEARGSLPGMNTDHFDDQASEAWAGVDKLKSGLNALLNYIDTGAPTKLIEARDKIQTGTAWIKQGVRGINRRRKVYGLRAIHL